MTRELIDHDPLTGVSTWFEPLEEEGKFLVHHTQDVEAALERNVRLYNEPEYKRTGIKREWMHYAHIPDVVVLQWMKEGIDVFNPNHAEAVKRKLRDPQFRRLRTTSGDI
jgi:hypothetical protein